MSDPRQQTRRAQTVKFGLLAARSAAAIAKSQRHEVLADEDREILGEAESFLRRAAEGAAFVTDGTRPAGGALASTEALEVALQPNVSPAELMHGRQPSLVFAEMADVAKELATGCGQAVQADLLRQLETFFRRLYSSLEDIIEHNRLRPIGGRRDATLGQHAW